MNAPNPPLGIRPFSIAPAKLSQLQADFMQAWLAVARQAQDGTLESPSDRRFQGEAWARHPASLVLAHTYLLSSQVLAQMVEAADMDEALRNRMRFTLMQWTEALSPANFLATNPDAQRALIETQGLSLWKGMMNLLTDISKGRLSQTDDRAHEVGRNLATTPGSVVYENRLFQLIQYTPTTAQVYEQPLLIVPPCINKYYILDLQQENSFVKYIVEQGLTVFMVSWRNPMPGDQDGIDTATWADYLEEGVLQAIDIVSDISGQQAINALGFCVGGTLLAAALALAKARGSEPVSSMTLLTTLLDFTDTGVLSVFVDENHAKWRESQLGRGGLMSARELGTTFSFLRPGELVWNYVASNYLKGETPPAFDILYWNADGTNLPGPFFSWYFRNTYLENRLKDAAAVEIDGTKLDISALDMPTYLYASRDDHIVPWKSAYASRELLTGPVRFVLGASGHIAGVINPPAKNKRHYWAHTPTSGQDGTTLSAEDWLTASTQHPGSWWPDWAAWIQERSGAKRAARKRPGNARYRALEAAPGRYVRQRA